jgi:hypothetical protein
MFTWPGVFLMAQPRIQQIPLPGGSGRVPTGAIQFQDDWPGLFVRGDEAIALLVSIRQLTARFGNHPDPVVWSALARLEAMANIIEREVRVRGNSGAQDNPTRTSD